MLTGVNVVESNRGTDVGGKAQTKWMDEYIKF